MIPSGIFLPDAPQDFRRIFPFGNIQRSHASHRGYFGTVTGPETMPR